jgi:integrase
MVCHTVIAGVRVRVWAKGRFVARNGSSAKGTSSMATAQPLESRPQRPRFTSRNDAGSIASVFAAVPDSLAAWIDRYGALAVAGVRSEEVSAKIDLHLERFRLFFAEAYGHDRISTVTRRDVAAWQRELAAELAAVTVNNHLASLSGFTSWVAAQAPGVFVAGDPARGLSGLALPPLEPRALSDAQVRSLKNLCDRLERFSQMKGRRRPGGNSSVPVHAHARPSRDRAIVFVLLSTGLRRQELVSVDLDQLEPTDHQQLRAARRARLISVRGKGGTQRTVFLSTDARHALADYLERERPRDAGPESTALWLSAATVGSRKQDGRLSGRAVNAILERIGRLHDAEHADPERHISPLRPHDLRHTFAFRLAEATGADAYELERRLGHRSARYIARYTNPPEAVAADYVEEL